MSRYVTELVGHPHQLQPSHIVITSPWFDTREMPEHDDARCGTRNADRDEKRRMIVNLRRSGLSFASIADIFKLSPSVVMYTYRRWNDRL